MADIDVYPKTESKLLTKKEHALKNQQNVTLWSSLRNENGGGITEQEAHTTNRRRSLQKKQTAMAGDSSVKESQRIDTKKSRDSQIEASYTKGDGRSKSSAR